MFKFSILIDFSGHFLNDNLPREFRVLFDDFIERSQNSGDGVVWSADVLLVARR